MQLQNELCVCELTHALLLSQPMVSRHLAVLKEAGIVIDRREGQWVYYQINPQLPAWEQSVLKITAEANARQQPFKDDLQILIDMPNRPNKSCCV